MLFRVDLPAYRGPLDLLLYLVRRQELDVASVALAEIVEQYIAYLDVLSELDVDGVGEFIEVASLLVEAKSQAVLPRPEMEEGEADQPLEDPQEELVQRLLEYKRVRDAASVLDELGERWQQRYGRLSEDLPPRQLDPGDQPIADLELWDLVSAFGRIMRESKGPPPEQVVHDETPIHVYMQRIHHQLATAGPVQFGELFEPGMHKTALIGLFLAVLELTRHHGVRTEQAETNNEITIVPGPQFAAELQVAQVDNYDNSAVERSNLPIRPR